MKLCVERPLAAKLLTALCVRMGVRTRLASSFSLSWRVSYFLVRFAALARWRGAVLKATSPGHQRRARMTWPTPSQCWALVVPLATSLLTLLLHGQLTQRH